MTNGRLLYYDLQCFDIVDWATGQEGHPACKKMGVGLLVEMISLELCTIYSSNCRYRFHHPLLH